MFVLEYKIIVTYIKHFWKRRRVEHSVHAIHCV